MEQNLEVQMDTITLIPNPVWGQNRIKEKILTSSVHTLLVCLAFLLGCPKCAYMAVFTEMSSKSSSIQEQ